MLRCAGFTSIALALFAAVPVASGADFAKKSAVELLPPSTIVYVEISQPGKIVDTAVNHPLVQQLQAQPDFQKALESPDMQEVRKVVAVFEEKLGSKWLPALQTLSGDGIYLGFEAGTQGLAVLVKSRDDALLTKTRDTFLELARKHAADEGRDDPIVTHDYHGVTAYQIDDIYYATLGPWLILTNKARVGQMIIDNALEADCPRLAADKQFQRASKQRPERATVWGYADLRIVRATGIAKNLLNKKSDNPAVELLIGGVISALPDAPFVTFSASLEAERIAFSTAIPHDPKEIKKREYYFGPAGQGVAPPLLSANDTIFALSTYRDFGLMWKQAPELFDDNINAKLGEAENGLTTIFGGRSFPDDILGNLQPGLQVVVVRQTFGKDDIQPAIRLPATAAVFTMKKPEQTARQFKITYQSLIGFLNIVGGMNGLEALEQDTEKLDKIMLVSAKYLPPESDEQRASAPLHFNASPTIAFVGDKFILASTRALALELAEQFVKDPPVATPGINTQLRIDGKPLVAALADNRAQLVTQNQQDKGHSQDDAEQEIDLLMKLLGGLREMSASLTTDNDALRFSWELKLMP